MNINLETDRGPIVPGVPVTYDDALRITREGHLVDLLELMTPTTLRDVIASGALPFMEKPIQAEKSAGSLEQSFSTVMSALREDRANLTLGIGNLHDGAESALFTRNERTMETTLLLLLCSPEPRIVAQGLREFVSEGVITQAEAANALAPFIGAHRQWQHAASLGHIVTSGGQKVSALMPTNFTIDSRGKFSETNAVRTVRILADMRRLDPEGYQMKKKRSAVNQQLTGIVLMKGKTEILLVNYSRVTAFREGREAVNALVKYYEGSGVLTPKEAQAYFSMYS